MGRPEVLLALLLGILVKESYSAVFSVDTDKNRIVDQFGRERLFHGTNVVFKTTPFIPITSHFDARFEDFILN